MKKTFILIEACYHSAYLINLLSDLLASDSSRYKLIVRDKRKLDPELLTKIHARLSEKKELSEDDFSELSYAYHGLSQAELALIKMHGVPKQHIFSYKPIFVQEKLNTPEIEAALRDEAKSAQLSAGIFLDCILSPWWLEVFENRIVNVHSAILPHARGMYAIEQVAATGDAEAFVRSAGATLHYIDAGVDTGPLIERMSLVDVWGFNSIWEVKGSSYLLAFDLLNRYLRKATAFTHVDVFKHDDPVGPEYKSRDFTDEVRERAEENYIKNRAINADLRKRSVDEIDLDKPNQVQIITKQSAKLSVFAEVSLFASSSLTKKMCADAERDSLIEPDSVSAEALSWKPS